MLASGPKGKPQVAPDAAAIDVRFLIADDRPESLVALEALLQREGLQILKARSGAEALELLLVHDFALALLDVQMPGMDGFELAELMRGTERTRRVPIIFLTGEAADDRRRFRGYESGAVDYILKPVDPQILTNKARIFFDLYRQRAEVARQRDELKAFADRLQAHRDSSPLAIIELDPALRLVSWSKGAERLFGWRTEEMLQQSIVDLSLVHSEDMPAFLRRAREMLAGSASRGGNLWRCRRRDGSAIDCEWYSAVLYSAAGAPICLSVEILDVTQRRRAEETQKLLIGELNHRVKNTLATVQAIALQTLRYTANPAEFAENFSGRLQSLAEAHSLLSNATWRGADLGELIDGQLRLGARDEARFEATGPHVYLAPQAALHLALILHELGTNARKYGALSTTAGRISLAWTIEDHRLQLTWQEAGGPPVKASARRGFGTRLIEESVKAEGGSAHVSFRAEGVVWQVQLPLSEMSAEAPVSSRTENDTTPVQALHSVETAASFMGKRFLVIEDEPLVALIVTSALQDAGADDVQTAATVEQAIGMIEEQPFSAAVLDGNLHGRPVDAVAAALTRRQIPFMFVSGYGRDGLPAAFRGVEVMNKPFKPEQLIAAMHVMLNRSGKTSQLRA
jgi:PAS domain S-box-containing protein